MISFGLTSAWQNWPRHCTGPDIHGAPTVPGRAPEIDAPGDRSADHARGRRTPTCTNANTCSILARVGFNNPSWSWTELEATLSGRRGRDGRAPGSLSWNAGGDSPAWGRKRQAFEPSLTRVPGTVPYAELHCHSNYSFLDGASHPEELATEAARLGLGGAGAHRPQRLLRRGPLRRGRPRRRPADRVRCRDHPHPRSRRRAARRPQRGTTRCSRSTPANCPTPTHPTRTVGTCSCSPTGRPAMPAWPGR